MADANDYAFRVVYFGDLEECKDYFKRNSSLNINVRNEQGETLLIHCVKRLQTKWTALFGGEFRKICKILIDKDIDVNVRDKAGKTAANYAAELQQLEILRLIIQKGARLDKAVLDCVVQNEEWLLAICATLGLERNNESKVRSNHHY